VLWSKEPQRSGHYCEHSQKSAVNILHGPAELHFIDAHTHVQFSGYDADRDAVFARAKAADVYFVNVGTQRDTSARAVEIAAAAERVFMPPLAFIPSIRASHSMTNKSSAEESREGVHVARRDF